MKTAALIVGFAVAGASFLTHCYFLLGWGFWHPLPAIMFWLLIVLRIGGAWNIELTMWLEFFITLTLASALVLTGISLAARRFSDRSAKRR